MHVAFLNDNFGARWMGTYGPIRWPARSPDLNPWDSFLWGYIRDNVYLTPPGTREELRRKVMQVCQEIPQNYTGCTMVKKKITLHSKNLKKLPALTNNSSLI
jgi:hypothetical protein